MLPKLLPRKNKGDTFAAGQLKLLRLFRWLKFIGFCIICSKPDNASIVPEALEIRNTKAHHRLESIPNCTGPRMKKRPFINLCKSITSFLHCLTCWIIPVNNHSQIEPPYGRAVIGISVYSFLPIRSHLSASSTWERWLNCNLYTYMYQSIYI